MPRIEAESERPDGLVFDWNEVHRTKSAIPPGFTLLDETLRDGLQNPSVVDPPIERKLRLLHAMEALGIDVMNVGIPAASPRAFADALALCKEAASAKLRIRLACAGRTHPDDVAAMLDLSQRAGVPLEGYLFIGSSPIRQYAEGWNLERLVQLTVESITSARKGGLPIAYVTEDTTRSTPDVLRALFGVAIGAGASRICLSDTVGHATPDGVANLVGFTKNVIAAAGATGIGIDWHGHNDRGLALENALWALEHGVDRVHATGLGIGERVGNTPMELLLLNLALLGAFEPRDLSVITAYCNEVAEGFQWPLPFNYPLVGRDAFRTATGVHAAAIAKALEAGDSWLADRVYSAVPAATVGRSQEICIGFMSGAWNVQHWLRVHAIEATPALVKEILDIAKAETRILADDEVMAIVRRAKSRRP